MHILREPEPLLSLTERCKLFAIAYWRGLIILITPIVASPLIASDNAEKWHFTAYTLVLMAVYWITEVLPLPVTGLLPIIIFPIFGVMDTDETCQCYVNDTTFMFFGCFMMAYALEQSGVTARFALRYLKLFKCSYKAQLFGVCFCTMFISMWLTNSATTALMLPIVMALMKVYERYKITKLYEKDAKGVHSTRLSTCFFCAVAFSATIGGIGSLTGTVTNLVHKGQFHIAYPKAPELLLFTSYLAFSMPYMIIMEIMLYLWLIYLFLWKQTGGAKKKFTKQETRAITKVINDDLKKLGKLKYREVMMAVIFLMAIVGFMTRGSGIIPGWAEGIITQMEITDKNFIQDSAVAIFVLLLLVLLPISLQYLTIHCSAKFVEDLLKPPAPALLDWKKLKEIMPFSFLFLLGGGFALAEAANTSVSGLTDVIGGALVFLAELPEILIIFFISMITTLLTNVASNVIVCHLTTPLAMQIAEQMSVSPLWYALAAGYSSSYAFMLPVGTPGNRMIQDAAKIRTIDMVRAGSGITILVIIFTWIYITFVTSIFFGNVSRLPDWTNKTSYIDLNFPDT